MLNVIQGSPEWLQARCGKITASRAGDLMAKLKDGRPGAPRVDYFYELLGERLTGRAADRFVSRPMQWGIDHEEEARRTAAFALDVEIDPAGFCLHERIADMGASPDGFVTDDAGEVGLVQIKCPLTKTHVAMLTGGGIDTGYLWQMQMEMACTGLGWCHFVSFDPRMPDELQLFKQLIYRDQEMIYALEAEAEAFLEELDTVARDLKRRYEEAIDGHH